MTSLNEQLTATAQKMAHDNPCYEKAEYTFKRAYLQQVLIDNGWNQCKAAKALGWHRNTLARHMRQVELEPYKMRLELRTEAQMLRDKVLKRQQEKKAAQSELERANFFKLVNDL